MTEPVPETRFDRTVKKPGRQSNNFLVRNRAGRPKGSKNVRSLDGPSLASPYGPEAIAVLVKLMRHSESEQTRAWAANALLDRAYGKPHQSVSSSNETVHYVVAMPELPQSIEEWKKLAAPHIEGNVTPVVTPEPQDKPK